MRKIDRRSAIAIAAVALIGGMALAYDRFAAHRPVAMEDRVAEEWVVTSAADRGDGTLREAIFAADTAPGRVRIVVRTPRIELRSALPPLVNPRGVVIEAGIPEVAIDLSRAGGAPALEVRAPHSELVGLALEHAAGIAVLVAAPDFRLSRSALLANGEGISVVDGAADVAIDNARFEANGVGLRVGIPQARVSVTHSRFAAHKEAAIWATHPPDSAFDAGVLAVKGNRFEGDRISVVAANAALSLERNEFVHAHEAAVMLLGPGAIVRDNQMRDGDGVAVFARDAARIVIERNEIARNQALGVLVRGSANATVRANKVYSNGYGMAFVLGVPGSPVLVVDNAVLGQRYDGIVVIGDSPSVRSNRTLNNGQAGLRLLDVSSPATARVMAAPFLEANTVTGNLLNDVVRGSYRLDTGANGK